MDTSVVASVLLALLLYINTLPADFAYDDRWVPMLFIESVIFKEFSTGRPCAVLIFERNFEWRCKETLSCNWLYKATELHDTLFVTCQLRHWAFISYSRIYLSKCPSNASVNLIFHWKVYFKWFGSSVRRKSFVNPEVDWYMHKFTIQLCME